MTKDEAYDLILSTREEKNAAMKRLKEAEAKNAKLLAALDAANTDAAELLIAGQCLLYKGADNEMALTRWNKAFAFHEARLSGAANGQ